jgi:hypothetical protein
VWREREREDNILKDPAPSVDALPVSVGSVLLVHVRHSTVCAGKTRNAEGPKRSVGGELCAVCYVLGCSLKPPAPRYFALNGKGEFVGIGKDSICPYGIILSRLGKIRCEGVDKSEETSLYVRCVSACIKSYTVVGHIKTELCCVTYVS